MKLDTHIVDAIRVFFLHGISPGSCATCLLRGEYAEAKARAHWMIKAPDDSRVPSVSKIWNDHIQFMEMFIPSICRGPNQSTWTGFYNESRRDPELNTVMILSYTDMSFVRDWIREGKELNAG